MKSDSSKPVKILLIDDESTVRRFLRLGLEPRGYTIDEAESGREGLEKIKAWRPDLVILDLGLPDQDGFEVLKSLREWSPVPVVVLTVRDSEAEKVALLEAGADDYVTKPFSLPELIARIQVALRHKALSQEPTPVFKEGALEIDFAEHVVLLNGRSVKLTATEFTLLRLLAQAGGRVVTQQVLLETVWGVTGVDNPHYLRIYIGHLRKKLETDPANPTLIVTEPGVGYRLGRSARNDRIV